MLKPSETLAIVCVSDRLDVRLAGLASQLGTTRLLELGPADVDVGKLSNATWIVDLAESGTRSVCLAMDTELTATKFVAERLLWTGMDVHVLVADLEDHPSLAWHQLFLMGVMPLSFDQLREIVLH
ncbi:MAG: hypothetical protein WBF53_06645 [Litorimonas sp.]